MARLHTRKFNDFQILRTSLVDSLLIVIMLYLSDKNDTDGW